MMLKFYAHQHRVRNQQLHIAKIFDVIRKDEYGDGRDVLELIDYKMKFESIRYREKTNDFFGKKGTSWHGAVIYYSDHEGGMRQLYFDHISSNDSMQDRFAVASICDAIFRRLAVELPEARNIHILSDNARCYQNDDLPVMLPFIVNSHNNFCLRTLIHTETQDGKSLVDAQFAIAMNYINKYVQNYAPNVITPHQIVAALNINQGLANTVAELVSIHRESPSMKKWLGVKKKGKIARVGRINEFQYAESEDGSYAVKAFPMSGFSCKHLIFSREGSRYVSRNEEHDPGFMENDLQDEYVERDNTMDDDNDFTEDIEPVVVHDDDISSREPHAYVGEETGIAVRTNASLRRVVRNLKRGKNGTGNVLQDTALELEGSSCEEIDDNGGVSHKCKYCEGMFSCKQELISHSATCCVQRGVQMAVRGATIAHRLISNEDTRVHWTATDSPALAPFAARISADVKKWYVRKVGSAASPAYGQSLGKNTTSKYANELLEFFKCGARDKRKRVNPPVMLERLREKYPRRYDLPAENFIIRFVSAQNKRLKDLEKRGLGIDELALPTEGRGKRMLAKYSDAINEIVKCSDGEIMPREGFGALISKLGLNEDSLPDDFPTMKTVKNKVSPLK